MSNSNNLDLSKFPKIVTPTAWDIRQENERYSQGLVKIREISDNLLDAIHAYLTDLRQMDAQARMVDQEKAELAEIEKQLRYQQHQLEVKEKAINAQQSYIEAWNRDHQAK